MRLVNDKNVSVPMVPVDERLDRRDLNGGLWILTLGTGLDNSMRNPHVIKAVAALLDKLSSVGEEDGPFALPLGPRYNFSGDCGFPSPCRGDHKNTTAPKGKLPAQPVQALGLIRA